MRRFPVLVDLLEAESLKSKDLADEYTAFMPTKRKRCLFQSFVASSECHGQPDTDGSIATKRVGRKGC
jgi:hypothetical protein